MGHSRTQRAHFEDLYDRHLAAVTAWAARRADPQEAQDIVSEVFLVAWRRIHDVPGDALPWLLAVANKVHANRRRSDRRRSDLVASLTVEATATITIAEPETLDPSLVAALRRLNERDRELVLLIALEELSVAQAARVLGMTAVTARVRLHRLRTQIRRDLRTQVIEPAHEVKAAQVLPDKGLNDA